MDSSVILRTLSSAHAVGATAEERAAEVKLYEELRNGDLRHVMHVAIDLVDVSRPLEARIMGVALLQHIVGNRWDELQEEERTHASGVAFTLVRQNVGMGVPYAVKSTSAVLLAVVLKRQGPNFMNESLNGLLTEGAQGTPGHQGLVCLVLKYLGDEVYQFTQDMSAEQVRDMLACLTAWVPKILTFLEKTIENNLTTVQQSSGQGGEAEAIRVALETSSVFAEFAPASDVYKSGLTRAAGFLLGSQDYRSASCDILKHVGSRKRTNDENLEEFNTTMQDVGMSLLRVAREVLANDADQRLDFEGEDEEFGLELCEAMVSLGQSHLLIAFPDETSRFAFLEQMLAFARHAYLPLASKALGLWSKLLQDSATVAGSQAMGQGHTVLPSQAVLVLMQVAAEQLQLRNPRVPQVEDDVPIYFDDFDEYKDFMVGYRIKLSMIVRSAAATLPEQALQTTVAKLTESVGLAKDFEASGTKDGIETVRSALEAAAVFAESTIKAVWEAVKASNVSENVREERKKSFVMSIEPVFTSTLELRVSDARLLHSQARALDAFSRLVGLKPELAQKSIANLLEIITTCMPLCPGENEEPPPRPGQAWREASQARSAIGLVFLEYAKASPTGFLPYLEDVASTLTQMYSAGKIRPGERNTIVEGLVVGSSVGNEDLQRTVIDWALSPIKEHWSSPAFQQSVSDLESFVMTYVPAYCDESCGNEVRIGGAKQRWILNHQVHLIERIVRRLSTDYSKAIVASHMEWIIPCMSQLMKCLNEVQSPTGRARLGVGASILEMSVPEKSHYLRLRQGAKLQPPPGDTDAGDYATIGGATISSARAWLRHTAEFVCHTLGLVPTQVPLSLQIPSLPGDLAPALFFGLDVVEHRYIRLILRHVTIPLVKTCPLSAIEAWVIPSLSILAPHMKDRLAAAWQAINTTTETQENSIFSTYTTTNNHMGGRATEEEVVHERIVRELTQEYADLLREVATRTFESKVSLLQLFLKSNPTGGIAAAGTAVEGMLRPDEAAYRFASFCRALVHLAPADEALYNYVGSDILYNSISSLSLEVMGIHQAEILGMIRDIIVQQMGNPASQVHNVLQMLPGVGPQELKDFLTSVGSTGSEKEQRNRIKSFLLRVCGKSSFAALADWKPPSLLTVTGTKNKTSRSSHPASNPASKEEEEHLQGEITRALLS